MPEFLILGAGPTGLGAAYRLKELGVSDFLVVDGAPRVGGLATSFRDPQGFTWDIGGHVQFSHYEYFDDLMDRALGRDGWLYHERESWIWIRERFVPYPFQNNLRHLPAEDLWRCLRGLVELHRNPAGRPPANFGEWIRATMGGGVAETFLEPYNFKVWAHPLTELSHEWVGDRVAVADLERVLRNVILGLDDVSWGPNSAFRFPRYGGTGAIWEAVGDLIGRQFIRLNSPVTGVASGSRQVTLADGASLAYQFLLNTIPLDQFVGLVRDAPPGFSEPVRDLCYSSSNIVGIGLEGSTPPPLATKCWMYFPESNSPFYRVTVFSNYSPNNVARPGEQWSLMAEVSESVHKPVNQETLPDDVLRGLQATRLIQPDSRIVSRWQYRADHGYPTPTLGRNAALEAIQAVLEPRNIFSRGRFGGWKYEVSNQDHSMMQGVEWANRMVRGEPEATYFFPGRVNAGRGRR